MLANKMVTAVRQRVTRDLLGRRGRRLDPAWVNRRLLRRGCERLSEAALTRMWNGCVDHDPSGQILSAWIAKEVRHEVAWDEWASPRRFDDVEGVDPGACAVPVPTPACVAGDRGVRSLGDGPRTLVSSRGLQAGEDRTGECE